MKKSNKLSLLALCAFLCFTPIFAIRQQPISAVQAICNELKQIIEHPSAEGADRVMPLFAQLYNLDPVIHAHYYQIFEQQSNGRFQNAPRQQIARQPVVRPVEPQPVVRHPRSPNLRPAQQNQPALRQPLFPQPVQQPRIAQQLPADQGGFINGTAPAISSNQPAASAMSQQIDASNAAATIHAQVQEIQQLRAQVLRLSFQLAAEQAARGTGTQQRPEPQCKPKNNQEQQNQIEAQQNRIAELEAQLHQSETLFRQTNERATHEHRLIELLQALLVQDQPSETEINNIIAEYNQVLHDLGFDMQPTLNQFRQTDLQATAVAVENISRIQDPVLRYFAMNHPIVQLVQQHLTPELLAEQIERQQSDAHQQQNGSERTIPSQTPAIPSAQPRISPATPTTPHFPINMAEPIRPSAPPLPDGTETQDPAILPEGQPPAHVTIDMPEAKKTPSQSETRNSDQPQSLARTALNYVSQLPRTALSGVANVYNGILSWWNTN